MRVLIVGAGIIGMTMAWEWRKKHPDDEIVIIDKELHEAFHASGKNSGVLHAGFYYSSDSLKAKLTARGNKLMKGFCYSHNIPVNETGKLVVAKNENEIPTLFELAKRSVANEAGAYIITQEEAEKIDPNAKTHKYALYSPNTATVNPREVCRVLKEELQKKDVKFIFNMPFEKFNESYDFLINAAGLYADKIAHKFGVGLEYTMLPFKGLYRKYLGEDKIKTQIYPVPNIKNPFLGVHFTLMADNTIKIGPTAIPAFWRENYVGFERFDFREFLEIISLEAKLFFTNAFGFRDLALYEMRYYIPQNLINEAKKLVKNLRGEFKPMTPGIRAQLLNTQTLELVMDFLVEKNDNQIHILNAVSPAFTASFAFSKYVLEEL
ncbi:NAD(P)/FAD-dependent oxidoreductase [Caminibacter pacificus]|uniref:FAD-dependent oxidoreductase n=1 Tax=Caminibacter pacificus TaxID=1424653 RepID=A0AAJ4RD39_9BACT|nr:FAD-dependent oxidoreductase [Caminibacter pacificus]QCI27580.1 FAD-dependent oxidoreductase [Caminibacter pacificus]ROR40241.1 L-2-hydroxyglutarate oxidase LhgO [Caminibacter pacificus]